MGRTQCPECSYAFDVPPPLLGRRGRCRNCNHAFFMAALAEQPVTLAPTAEAGPSVAASAGNSASAVAEPPAETGTARTVTLGRGADCGNKLDAPTVSRRHAQVRQDHGHYSIADLGSSAGTFVNDIRIKGPRALRRGDLLRIGPYLYYFDGRELVSMQTERGAGIEVRGLGKQVRSRETGKMVWILRDINLSIRPREFVGVLGTSGSGKSTLSDALNGRRPASEGSVRYNDSELYEHFDALKKDIGYVPQELILHEGLPVADALRYACRLRLPADTLPAEIEENIRCVLEIVGLAERGNTQIERLSGGQKKRVAVAVELLSKPTVLFLDEATSGLDHVTEADMMKLFRSVADKGTTTVCVTHFADSLEMCDKVAFLVKGYLAFYGPPAEMKKYFGVTAIHDVLYRQSDKTPEEWKDKFERSPLYAQYAAHGPTAGPRPRPAKKTVTLDRSLTGALRQFPVVTKRSMQLLLTDKRGLVVSLVLPIIIGAMIYAKVQNPVDRVAIWDRLKHTKGSTSPYKPFDGTPEGNEMLRQYQLMGYVALSVFFLGLFASIREIVKESSIYQHERFNGLRILPYVGSKVVTLALVGAAQATILMVVIHWWLHFLLAAGAFPILGQMLILLLTVITSLLLGLAVSALVRNENTAVILMVILILPHFLFAGAVQLIEHDRRETFIRCLISTYWSAEGFRSAVLKSARWFANENDTFVMAMLALAAFSLVSALLTAVFLKRRDFRDGFITKRVNRLRRRVAGLDASAS